MWDNNASRKFSTAKVVGIFRGAPVSPERSDASIRIA